MSPQVVDASERSRYEFVQDGVVLGYAAYQRAKDLIVFTHTEIDPKVAGQGVGGRLIRPSPRRRTSAGRRGSPNLPVRPAVDAPSSRVRRPGLPSTGEHGD